VTLQRQPRIVRLHPLAVVFHPDQALATELRGDHDTARPGVETVLDQLLHHRCRPLDHLASGNLIREISRQSVNLRHQPTIHNPQSTIS
jgi:hypothetical protein